MSREYAQVGPNRLAIRPRELVHVEHLLLEAKRRQPRPPTPGEAPLPPPPAYSRYLAGGLDAAIVGEDRTLVAAAALQECSAALGIEKPHLRFFEPRFPRAYGVGDGHLAQFNRTDDGRGLVLVPHTGKMSLRELGEAVAHECAHAAQSQTYGGFGELGSPERRRFEEQARSAAEDFGAYLQRCWSIFREDLFSGPLALRWAKSVLLGIRRPRATWTAPRSLLALDGRLRCV